MRPWLSLLIGIAAAAGCADRGITPPAFQTAADSADQILERMTTTIVADGVRRSLVQADTAYMYQDRQVADMRILRATFFDQQGNAVSVLTSKAGLYAIGTGMLEARDSVVVVSLDGSRRKLTTQHLLYDRNANVVRSDSAFVYETATETLRGTSFTSDPDFRNVTTRQPQVTQRGGAGVPLPGTR